MRVLVVNAGSSSLKASVLDERDQVVAALDLEAWDGESTADIERFLAGDVGRIDAVGHRVVHGGAFFRSSVRVDENVLAKLRTLTELAPLHQPRALAGIDTVAGLLPDVPAVACFDTAFHAELPDAAAQYALPGSFRERFGLRRFGFHGLSHAYASRRAAEMLDVPIRNLRIVTCHLGAGASLAAVVGGRSVDTTMGFTPLEGLVMATRSGTVDPGLLLWLMDQAHLSTGELQRVLEHESGLAGLSGGSGDLRYLVPAAERGDPSARLAVRVYLHRLRREAAAMAAAMNGLDVLVFTGGVGEHQPPIRLATAKGLRFLGVAIDEKANSSSTTDAEVTADGSAVRTLVVAAREDLEIASQVRTTLDSLGGAGDSREPTP